MLVLDTVDPPFVFFSNSKKEVEEGFLFEEFCQEIGEIGEFLYFFDQVSCEEMMLSESLAS